jgi:hypothetical protein
MGNKLKDNRPYLNALVLISSIGVLFMIYLFLISKQYETKKTQELTSEQNTNHSLFEKKYNPNIDQNNEVKRSNILDKQESDHSLKPDSIDDLARQYNRGELILMSECSKAKIDLKLVKDFIFKSRDKKNHQELLGLANIISGNNLRLKLELVRYTNKKYPHRENAKLEKGNLFESKKISSKSIFKKIKKND